MTDEHQTNAIIATAILDSLREQPDHKMEPEEAKIIAKRILAALEDAGLQITPLDQSRVASRRATHLPGNRLERRRYQTETSATVEAT